MNMLKVPKLIVNNFGSRCLRKVFLESEYMLLGPKNPFLLTIMVNFDTIPKLGTYMYNICGLRTHNGTGTIQYIPVLYIFIYNTFLPEHFVSSGMTF